MPSDEALVLISMLSCNSGVEHEQKDVRGFALVPYAEARCGSRAGDIVEPGAVPPG
jgi:hypothetical protein